MNETNQGPLAGVRVMEFCWVWSGPFLGQLLADLGAEVIKIEWYDRFDLYRTRGVERLRGKIPEEIRRESSPSFHSVNRNKVGLALNLKNPRGIEIARRLAAVSDVVIDNFTSGTMESLGLGARDLHAVNEKLAVVSLSGFGEGSRLDAMRAYGSILSSLSGVESLIRDDGEIVGSPTFVISDPNAAFFGAFRVALALAVTRAGGGGVTDVVSQLEASISLLTDVNGEPDELSGNFATSEPDRYVHVRIGSSATGFAGMSTEQVAQWCAQRSAEDAIRELTAGGAEAVRMLSLDEAARSEFFDDTETRIPTMHPITGNEDVVAAPWRHNGRRPAVRKPAPTLAEGNLYVLHQILGMRLDDIHELQAEHVI